MKIFLTGIGTGVGKTIISAILCEAFQADYWKPVQAGNLHDSDTMRVERLTSNKTSVFHPETYRFSLAASPHKAAAFEKQKIQLSRFTLPKTNNHLIVEGAGGLLVPLNFRKTMHDLAIRLDLPVVIVSRHYLGSINHTLLTIEELRSSGLGIAGVIFNGNEDKYTEEAIVRLGDVKMLARVRKENSVSRKMVAQYATEFRKSMTRLFAR